MEWIEFAVVTHNDSVEAISEIFIQHGSKGVVIEDPLDYYSLNDEQREWLQVKQSELFQHTDVIVKAYFALNYFTDEIKTTIIRQIEQLQEFGLNLGKQTIEIQTIGENDWADAWKTYYFPVRVTRYITIVPDWIDYQPQQDNELLIRLDPGLAFGTGTHPTTQLSILALEQYIRGGETVIDVGTGSGVLSIVSKALGVKSVTAFDIDEVATRVSKDNIALNPWATEIEVRENNLLVDVHQKADLIVANILAEVLLLMPKDAFRNLNDNGTLILSGIIDSKVDEVIAAYVAAGFEQVQRLHMKEWNAIVFQKKEVEE